MKKVLFILTVAITVLSTSVVNAQDKIGYVRSLELVDALPEYKVIEAEINKLADEAQATITSLQTEYETEVQKFQAEEALMTDIVKESKFKYIQDMKLKIEGYYESSQQRIIKERQVKLSPLLDKVNTAISEVAKENGYTFIIDYDAAGQAGILLYADESKSVMSLVKSKLGL